MDAAEADVQLRGDISITRKTVSSFAELPDLVDKETGVFSDIDGVLFPNDSLVVVPPLEGAVTTTAFNKTKAKAAFVIGLTARPWDPDDAVVLDKEMKEGGMSFSDAGHLGPEAILKPGGWFGYSIGYGSGAVFVGANPKREGIKAFFRPEKATIPPKILFVDDRQDKVADVASLFVGLEKKKIVTVKKYFQSSKQLPFVILS